VRGGVVVVVVMMMADEVMVVGVVVVVVVVSGSSFTFAAICPSVSFHHYAVGDLVLSSLFLPLPTPPSLPFSFLPLFHPGTIVFNGPRPEESPPIHLDWKAPMSSVSGLAVASLQLTNERYRPYKGVRALTKSGRFQVRINS